MATNPIIIDVENIEADVVNFIKAGIKDLETGNMLVLFADAATAFAAVEAAAQQLLVDVNAAIPAPIKAFLNGTATLAVTLTLPVAGSNTAVFFHGTQAQFLAAVSGGMPLFPS